MISLEQFGQLVQEVQEFLVEDGSADEADWLHQGVIIQIDLLNSVKIIGSDATRILRKSQIANLHRVHISLLIDSLDE